MKKISYKDYYKLPADYRGVWTTHRNDFKEGEAAKYMGKRTWLTSDEGGTVLLVEGMHFEITGIEKTVIDYFKQEYQVSIEPGHSITINCIYTNRHNPKPTSIKFYIGDKAEYDSWNVSYIGTITAITENTVSIVGDDRAKTKHMLKLARFCDRNWDFDLEYILKKNASYLD